MKLWGYQIEYTSNRQIWCRINHCGGSLKLVCFQSPCWFLDFPEHWLQYGVGKVSIKICKFDVTSSSAFVYIEIKCMLKSLHGALTHILHEPCWLLQWNKQIYVKSLYNANNKGGPLFDIRKTVTLPEWIQVKFFQLKLSEEFKGIKI